LKIKKNRHDDEQRKQELEKNRQDENTKQEIERRRKSQERDQEKKNLMIIGDLV